MKPDKEYDPFVNGLHTGILLGLWITICIAFFIAVLLGCAPTIHKPEPLQVRRNLGPEAVGDDLCWQYLTTPEKPGECP